MSSPPQVSRMLPQRQPAPDTTQAAPADTAPLGEALRSDSTLYYLRNPAEAIATAAGELSASLADPALWLGLLGFLLKTLIIFVLALAAIRLIDRVTDRWTKRLENLPPSHPRRQRTYTISNLISSTGRYVLWPIAVIMILSELNIDIAALLATAGIAGLAIGFGAQTLVKDVISGIFLLFDDSIHVGDLVRIDSEVGMVEHIGVRLIKVRRLDGEVLMVPAGELRIFGNRSIGFARALVNVGLSYEQDIDSILPVIEHVAKEWVEEQEEIMLEDEPTVQAITEFGDSAVTVRVMVKVRPGEHTRAERDLRLRLKRAFDELGIEIPFPRHTVYTRPEEEAPPRTITYSDGDAHSDSVPDSEGSD